MGVDDGRSVNGEASAAVSLAARACTRRLTGVRDVRSDYTF
jgi:hypothetical protein